MSVPAIITSPLDNTVQKYLGRLNHIVKFIRTSKRLLAVYFLLCWVIWKSTNLINHLRKLLSQSQTTSLTSNLHQIYQQATEIRNKLVEIKELSDQKRLFIMLTPFLNQVAIDWDDLVEECALMTDADIEILLNRVAHVV
jgi:hypothetical protein